MCLLGSDNSGAGGHASSYSKAQHLVALHWALLLEDGGHVMVFQFLKQEYQKEVEGFHIKMLNIKKGCGQSIESEINLVWPIYFILQGHHLWYVMVINSMCVPSV